MPIHFAAARSAARSPVARALARKALRRAANDNPGGPDRAVDPILHAALRHFGEHGLNAAREAAALAESAWRAGEIDTCQWWTGICSKLDRALARELLRRIRSQDVL